MEIAIFTDLTTNEHLDQLKVESEKYTGLYVDMENAKERKYVKDKADGINQLLKKVERKRIDASKEYKIKVEAEAADIIERLQIANLPFTLLIDEYKEERKRILDAEKAEREAIELEVKIEADHEFALLMNDKFDNDKILAEQERIKHEDKLKEEGAIEARRITEEIALENERRIEQEKKDAISRELLAKEQQAQAERDLAAAQEREKLAAIAAEEQRKKDAINAENKRLADIEKATQNEIKRQADEKEKQRLAQVKIEPNKKHVGLIRSKIKENLMSSCDINNELATKIVKELLKIEHVTINY